MASSRRPGHQLSGGASVSNTRSSKPREATSSLFCQIQTARCAPEETTKVPKFLFLSSSALLNTRRKCHALRATRGSAAARARHFRHSHSCGRPSPQCLIPSPMQPCHALRSADMTTRHHTSSACRSFQCHPQLQGRTQHFAHSSPEALAPSHLPLCFGGRYEDPERGHVKSPDTS